jgi:hypothetical protein
MESRSNCAAELHGRVVDIFGNDTPQNYAVDVK